MVDALASRGDEGRGRLRYAPGSCQASIDPGISESGNRASPGNRMASSASECIARVRQTQGTETSQYLEEKKSTETPSVAASEGGISPNRGACTAGLRALEELQKRR